MRIGNLRRPLAPLRLESLHGREIFSFAGFCSTPFSSAIGDCAVLGLAGCGVYQPRVAACRSKEDSCRYPTAGTTVFPRLPVRPVNLTSCILCQGYGFAVITARREVEREDWENCPSSTFSLARWWEFQHGVFSAGTIRSLTDTRHLVTLKTTSRAEGLGCVLTISHSRKSRTELW